MVEWVSAGVKPPCFTVDGACSRLPETQESIKSIRKQNFYEEKSHNNLETRENSLK